MKKITLIVGLLIVLSSSLFLYYKFNNSDQVPESKTGAYLKSEQLILLYPLSGEVSFKAAPNDVFQKATASPTIIPNQAIVHTNIGKASVLLPDNSSISLENNTEITVNFSEKNTTIYQNMGATYHRVEKLLSGATYQVQTAGTLAAVRGTRFAVKYDVKSKKTKVAVTENKVEVATIPKASGTTTPPAVESVLVEAGKTVSVETFAVITKEKPSAMQIVDTNKDTEMRVYVEEQKKVDIQIDILKKESTGKEEFRKEIKRTLFNDKEEDSLKDANEINSETKEEPASDDVSNKKVEEVPVVKIEKVVKPEEAIKPEVVETPVVIQKVSEEEFFTAFEPLFLKYFYIEDSDDVICTVKVSPEDRVRIVKSLAESKGYPFTKETLLSFAQEIDKYCLTKDKDLKIKLQSRFEAEYPF